MFLYLTKVLLPFSIWKYEKSYYTFYTILNTKSLTIPFTIWKYEKSYYTFSIWKYEKSYYTFSNFP